MSYDAQTLTTLLRDFPEDGSNLPFRNVSKTTGLDILEGGIPHIRHVKA
jgi:hypothetical protein